MSDVWYRGESTTVAPARPGAYLHDFGEGLYFTDSVDVARKYAEGRVAEGGGVPQVFAVNVERAQLGKVLDLTTDSRWIEYMRTPAYRNGPTPEQIIRTAGNENYSRFFDAFVSMNRIDLRNYNAVIGPELVRGGTQMCLLHQGGRPSALALQMRQQMRMLPRVVETLPLNIPTVAPEVLLPNSRLRRAAGNQAAGATLGMMIYGALQGIAEAGLRKRTQQDIDGRLSGTIANILGRGEGVLVIAAISETDWITPMGDRLRSYLTTYVQPGASAEAALQTWRSEPKVLQGAPTSCHVAEQYIWIPPVQ